MARFTENRERPLVALGITHSPPNADVLLLTKEELREIISCVSVCFTLILYRFTYLVVTCLVVVCLVVVCHIGKFTLVAYLENLPLCQTLI